MNKFNMPRVATLCFFLFACSAPPSPGDDTLDSGQTPRVADTGAVVVPEADRALEPTVAFRIDFAPSTPVEPGGEGLHCQVVPGPTVDTYVSGWAVHRRSGIHHVNVYRNAPGTPGAPGDCGDFTQLGTWILDAAQSEMVWDFGAQHPGAAMLLKGGVALGIDVHFVNTSEDPMRENASVEFFAAATHTAEVNPLRLIAGGAFTVKPAETKTATFECTNTSPRDVLVLASHSHAHNSLFTISVNGSEKYRSVNWQDPPINYFNSLKLVPGDRVGWACTVENTTVLPLSWGSLVNSSEMCTAQAIAIGPTWTCQGSAS